jgi:hypothetical protein
MVAIWLVPLIITIFVVIVFMVDGEGWFGIVISPLVYLAFLLLCALTFGVIGGVIADAAGADYDIVVTQEEPLIALKDNSDITGKFFLGCGTVEKTQYYYYISYVEGKGYTVQKDYASGCYLEYLNKDCKYKEPCRVVYQKEYTNPVVRWLIPSMDGWTTYYIPEGSIINDYKVDLE